MPNKLKINISAWLVNSDTQRSLCYVSADRFAAVEVVWALPQT